MLALTKTICQVWRRRACVTAFSHQLCIGRQCAAPNSSPAYSSVRYGQPCQPGKWQVFRSFGRTFFISGGQFFAEDSSSFDSLVFKRKKQKTLVDSFASLDREFFISTENLKKNCSADSFSGFDSFVFHFGGEFHRHKISTTTFESDSTKYWEQWF